MSNRPRPTGEGAARAGTPEGAPVAEVVRGLAALGHALVASFREPADTEPAAGDDGDTGNVVVSPLSVGVALAMARAGASGATGAGLDRLLGFPAEGVHAALSGLTSAVVTVEGPPPPRAESAAEPLPPVVALANGLFVREGLPLAPGFLREVTTGYGAAVRTVDFAGDAAEVINAWARERTAGRVDRLFTALDPATRLLLANALYLRAQWARPFTELPAERGPFALPGGGSTEAEFMRGAGVNRYVAVPGAQAVELPYAPGELAMWVLLPEPGAPPAAALDPGVLAQVATGLEPVPVDLALPRWDFSSSLDLMTALGLGGGDYSGMLAEGAGPLGLDQAVHRATVTVDEWGTEAAAVTGLAFLVAAPPPPEVRLRADRPFAFAIVHTPTCAPLFTGQVTRPA
ncbi:serpin B [Thermocatellispora tengchongensis]|uniref:Serpin B n=1 Tax=Thermocatellispora tengchongensis TaxID=1073253 RepID=A0A840P7W0_9ACTN|nr:serpin family protein [Thermocatellispora tengchongensis]MBB5135089.1 serpin B [Thermocatellispora tengchongensis]